MAENKTILRLKDKVSDEVYHLLTNGYILYLTPNKKWFDMIASGEKKEEYREIKPYWAHRLVGSWIYRGRRKGLFPDAKNSFMSSFDIFYLQKYDAIVFQNGYGDVPTAIVECKGVEVKQGKEEWGAKRGINYFTLLLGDVLYKSPINTQRRQNNLN